MEGGGVQCAQPPSPIPRLHSSKYVHVDGTFTSRWSRIIQKKQPDFGFLSHNSSIEVGLRLKMSEVEGWYLLNNYSFWKVTVVYKN